MAEWTLSKNAQQNGRYFTQQIKAVTTTTDAEETLIDFSALTTTVNGKVFTSFSVLNIIFAHSGATLSGTAIYELTWDEGGTGTPFFVVGKGSQGAFDFRNLMQYGFPNPQNTSYTGDVNIKSTNAEAVDVIYVTIEGYLQP